MGAQAVITQRDIDKVPQFVVEGKTVATYAVTPSSPQFAQALCDAILVDAASHSTVDGKTAGDVDRQDRKITRQNNLVILRGKLQATDEALLKWCMSKPSDADGSPDESREFIQAYKNNEGNVTYQTWKGCKPQSCTLAITPDYTTFEVTMTYHSRTESTTARTTVDSTITYSPLMNDDVPDDSWTYNSVAAEYRTASVTVSFDEGPQDSAGTTNILWRRPTMRHVSGSIDLFKKSGAIQADALAQTARAASLKVSTGITLTFGDLVMEPSGEDIRGDHSDAVIESKSFTAKSVTVS